MNQHLTAHHLAKSYHSRKLIKNVSLVIEPGRIVGLLGPNGAGKTTCFYLMLGWLQADAGQILLDGADITRLKTHERARLGIGYLPQEASIFRKLSVAQNIQAILETRTDMSAEAQSKRLEALLDEFHLQEVRHTLGIALSGGERRRAEIARTLASDPRYVFLDEPFAGVDPISLLDIKQLIQDLSKRGIGVMITDHNVRETLAICHHAYILNQGVVLAQGTPEHILQDKQVRQVYLGQDFVL